MSPLDRHDNIVLQFSGGKDSLACLHLLKPYWNKICVVWMNTGSAYPETVSHMREIEKIVPHFKEIRSYQEEWIRDNGLPSDLVPTSNTVQGSILLQTPILIQSWFNCCAANLWVPMENFVKEHGATLVIRGQKVADYRKAPVKSGDVVDGIEYYFPIEFWTTEEVKNYLSEIGINVPSSYEWADTSLDCWNCTAWLDEREKELSNLRLKYPDFWKEVRQRLISIEAAVQVEHVRLKKIVQQDENGTH